MQTPLRPRRNDARIVEALSRHGELDRKQLTAVSGLARSTVTDVIARLATEGIVVERPTRWPSVGRIGRPPTVISLVAPKGFVGVLAFTHATLQAAVVTFDGVVQSVRSVGSADFVFTSPTSCVELLDGALRDANLSRDALSCAVIGIPLPVRRAGRAAWPAPRRSGSSQDQNGSDSLWAWLNGDPAGELSTLLGLPAWIENDANLGALGEASFGAGQGMDSLIYLKIVHGIGAGIVLGGTLVRGASGLAGELGHMHVRDDGPLCTCGSRGCLVTQFNSPLLVDQIQPVYEVPLTLQDVLSLAAQGDSGVARILSDLGRTIGRLLGYFCVYLNPEGIILDPLLGPASESVIHGIREALSRCASPIFLEDVRVLTGVLGPATELLGAVALARANHTDSRQLAW